MIELAFGSTGYTQDDQGIDIPGLHTDRRSDDIKSEPRIKRFLTAVAVHQRSVDQLSDRQTDKIARQ